MSELRPRISVRRLLGLAALALLAARPALAQRRPTRPAARPPASSCPAPRVSLWEAIHDEAWPLIRHVEGDSAWAHLAPEGLPAASATWCNPLAADAEAKRAGADLYVQHCASCHGVSGRGDGMSAHDQHPAPYDFTRPEFAGMREPPGPAVLYAILTRGIDGTTMAAHGDRLSGWERLAVLAYVGDLPGAAAIAASKQWADTLRQRRRQ